jgi:photosystem II stability/assembly factor-like uncharacterized protein
MNLKVFAILSLTSGLLPTCFATGPTVSRTDNVGVINPSLYSGLVWRNIGPFRGGRVSAVSGAIGQPGVFYAGMPLGGVWKTTNAGITWAPIFDDVKNASSIGSVQVAPSNPNIVYVGLGDGTTGGGHDEGDGVYKSIDGGKTWVHMGLEFAKQIPSLLVDPKNPDIVLAAVLGDSKSPSLDRGGYRTTDGGKTWKKTLITNNMTGVQNLNWAFDNPNVILGTTARHCNAGGTGKEPDEPNGFKNTCVVKSEDGGLTWKQLKGHGLPESMSGRTCVAVAMHTNSQRMFFVSNSGLWRSEDGGANWQQMDKEDFRVRNGQGGYNCGVYVNSADPDTVYVLNTCSYVSHDGGKTFTGFKGAPGGDDPQQMWIDPTDGNRLFFGVDQGPTISLDAGKTWSGWYNIANGQFYHIAVSNSWPYWIYATMQDSGAIGMSSRGNYGEITPLDWQPDPGWEWGSITVDPLNANTLYSTGQSNDVIKQSFPTGQWVSVSPDNDPKLHLRHDFNQPIMFSPVNPHELFLGYQFLMSSTDGGRTWHKLGPDLTFPKGYVPPKPEKKDAKKDDKKTIPAKKANEKEPDEDVDKVQDQTVDQDKDTDADDDAGDQNINPKDAMERVQELMSEGKQRRLGGGAICSLSPSSIDGGIIWAGISNGTIKLTKDHGKTWDDVNIPNSTASIDSIDASHTDPASAYAVVSSNSDPLVYRTKDFGKTWTKIVKGLPTGEVTGSYANVVRADTKKDGLLFLGTESSMYVSFDDGDNWQSLRLNSPTTSYRDIVVKDNDLVVGTYGRSFWILDDLSPLRQVSTSLGSAHLFAPGDAIRVRRNVNQDTPMPPEVPHALNAPPGALIYYYLGVKPASDVTLDITDSTGFLVRHYTSAEMKADKEELQPIPDFWKEVPKPLPAEVGTNRMNWDLRYENPPALAHEYDISATPYLTPASPQGPLVPPGTYNVTLTVDGQKMTQKVTVKNDPRSPGSARDIREQHELQMDLYLGDIEAMKGLNETKDLKDKIAEIEKGKVSKETTAALDALTEKISKIGGSGSHMPAYVFMASTSPANFGRIQGDTVSYLAKMEFGDLVPSQPVRTAVLAIVKDLKSLEKSWKEVQEKDLKTVNAMLAKENLAQLSVAAK